MAFLTVRVLVTVFVRVSVLVMVRVLVEVTVMGENAAPHRNPIRPAPRSPKIKATISKLLKALEAMPVTAVTFTFNFSVPFFPKVGFIFRGVYNAYYKARVLALKDANNP